MDAIRRKANFDLTTPLLTPEPARSDDKKQASSPVAQASSPRFKPSADAGRFVWVEPRHRTPGSPLSGKLAGGASGPASWLARWKASAPAEADIRSELLRSLHEWAVAGAASGDSKRAQSLVEAAVAKYLPADRKIEPLKVMAAVTQVRHEVVAPMVNHLIEDALVHASVGEDGHIVIASDLIEELMPLLWKLIGPRVTADATELREDEGTVTAPPLDRQHLRTLLADLLPASPMTLCDASDYPILEAAYKDYHSELSALVKGGQDLGRMGIRRYVLEKLRLGQAAAIRETMLASVEPREEAQRSLWGDAFDAAVRHIQALRTGELEAFRLEDFIAERVAARFGPHMSASSSTTTTSSSGEAGR